MRDSRLRGILLIVIGAGLLRLGTSCLADLSGTLCDPDGTCVAGYECCQRVCIAAGSSCDGGTDAGGDCCSDSALCPTQPVKIQTSGSQDSPWGLTIDSNSLYWVNNGNGSVWVAPLDGGKGVTLVSPGTLAGRRIAVSQSCVFWTEIGATLDSGVVMRAGLDGGEVSVLSDGESFPTDIAADEQYVYWMTNVMGSSFLRSEGQDGGTDGSWDLAKRTGSDRGFVINGTSAYWAAAPSSEGGPGRIGTNLLTVIDAGGTLVGSLDPYAIAIDAQHVYWINDPDDGGSLDVFRAELSDGSNPQQLATTPGSASDMVVDANALYWIGIGNDGGGYVRTLPLDGGLVSCLASGLMGPFRMTQNTTTLYWTDNQANALYKIAK
jgi:hypothetical protein